MLFSKTMQYSIHIFDKILFFKYAIRQIKLQKKIKLLILTEMAV